MRLGLAWGFGVLLCAATPASGETLADVLRALGLRAPSGLSDLDRTLAKRVAIREGGDAVVVYDAGDARGAPRLVVLRLVPGATTFTQRPLAWPASAPDGLDADACRRLDTAQRHGGWVLLTAHVNPSAACTLMIGPDLALRAVLPGWPVSLLPDGRIVYQKNQIHFASSHPLALGLFDPGRLADTPLHPRKPYQAVRTAHAARMRQVLTDAWCAARNHPCDPDSFDEHLASEVLVDSRGEALVFAVLFDNTTGWSDAERWGRLEPFRELRAALRRWDGQGPPPDALARGLLAGLTRARNLDAGPHIAAALSGDPELRDLVGAALASPRPAGVDATRWLPTLDSRWAQASTWQRLARLVEAPNEFTEVVYVYAGLRRSSGIRYRELLRRDFETRFGRGLLGVALEPAVLRQLFGTPE